MDSYKPSSLLDAIRAGANALRDFAADDDGVTAIEYGLIAALLILTILAGFTAMGTAVRDLYEFWVSAALAAIASAL